MLKLLRENATSAVVQVLFGAIILVFIFFGINPSDQQAQTVAKVNGRPITNQELNRQLRRRLPLAGNDLTDEQLLQIRQSTLDQMIDRELYLLEARKRSYLVSDGEVARTIQKVPQFQDEDGNFSIEKYKSQLSDVGQQRSQYERGLREDLQYGRAFGLVRNTVTVLPSSVRDQWKRKNDTINLEFVRVSSFQFESEVDLSDEVVEAWLKDHIEDARTRYDERFDTDFSHDEQARARHILLSFGPDMDDATKIKLFARAERIRSEAADEGLDFAELAKKYSEDPGSTPKGGDLGWFTRDKMVEPFSNAAFALKPGEVSGVVESRFGYHIIKLEELKDPSVDRFDDVKQDLAKTLLKEEQAPAKAAELAETLRTSFEAGEDISAALSAKGLRVEETGDFTGDVFSIPRIGDAPEVLAWALETTTAGESPGRVILSGGNAFLLRVKSRSSSTDADYDDDARFEAQRSLLNSQRGAWDAAHRAVLREQASIRIVGS